METSLSKIIGRLIQEHFEIEAGLRQIAIFSGENDREIRLIEINEEALPTGQVEPFVFSPDEQVPFPILIADVTPEEWDNICNGHIPLPEGWPSQPLKVFNRN